MKRVLYYIYFFLVGLPLFIVATLITAIVAGIGSAFISEKVFGYYPGKIWSRITLALCLCPIKVVGRENIPKDRPVILIANHESALDIFMLYGYMGIPFKWILKNQIRKIPFVGWACLKCGFIYVDNSSPQAAAKTILNAEEAAEKGYSIFVFPEGSRSPDGVLKRFKRGAFKIALDTQATILPVGISGAHEALPKGKYIPRPHKLTLRIGLPFESKDYEISPKGLVSLTQEGYSKVKQLIDD